MNRKKRRHDGRVNARTTLQIKYSEISKLCLEPHEFWDDWEDYRDGLRCCKDAKKIRPEYAWYASRFNVKKYNKKNKLLLKRRQAKRFRSNQLIT